ncbi:mitochondrial carrier domain-containing protein [Kockovaella imperatae]|uniref:Mitochondrial carrier domain-containing protein n=1 Tax=Kockovaella imperatae TaxID=4999 RepID=A0A1Y1U7J9_9TREE|nr:mitochondrial carrier domain-containing protein [Kockovaella imperatae]ORX34009.1 mitochondrial carrier domain-containing protein [Kockovaella imperatae]
MSSSRPPLTPIGSALAGALGAVVSNAVVYPLDTVKTRLQALPDGPSLPSHATVPVPRPAKGVLGRDVIRIPERLWARIKKLKMLAMLIKIVKTEGLGGTFKGFTANMLNTFSQQFAYFFFHTWIRKAAMARLYNPHSLSTSSELLLGAAAGALAQIFTIPVSVVATRQQLWTPSDQDRSAGVYGLSLLETAKEIVEESGPSGLWTGLKPGLVLTVNPAITYGAFERIKSYVLSSREGGGGAGLSMMENFFIGVTSKAIATIVTYPYIFAKVRLQAKAGDNGPVPELAALEASVEKGVSYADAAAQEPASSAPVVAGPEKGVDPKRHPRPKHKHAGAITLLRAVYAEKGFGGWYQGIAAQLIKAVLCQGILFVSKDQFERWTWLILITLARLRARIPLVAKT